MLDASLRHVSYACRTIVRTPMHSAAVILTLALGIGASSAVYTAIDAVLLEPLPFPNPDRLVRIRQTRAGVTVANVAPVRLEDWFERSTSFEAMTGYTTQHAAALGDDAPEHIQTANVAPRMVETFGVAPILGRAFQPSDHEAGAAPVALISESLWERRFNRDTGVIGQTIIAGDTTNEIIGVMPTGFAFPAPDVEVWGAYVYADFVLFRGNAWYTSFGRLKPGVSVAEAQADLRRVQAQLAEEYPDFDSEVGVSLEPLHDMTVGGVRASLWLLFGAVSVLLLIACTNIAALLLARATDRDRGAAVRLSLGASRRSIVFQVLTETGVLVVLGAALGLFGAEAAVRAFRALAPEFPRIAELRLSSDVLIYVTFIVIAVTLACGLAPAFRNSRRDAVRRVASGTRSGIASGHTSQWVLVGVQVAMSVALLSGTGLLVRSLQELSRIELGYEPANVLTFRVTGTFTEPLDSRYQTVTRIVDELAVLPGAIGVATSSPVPGVRNDGSGFQYGASTWDSIEGGANGPIIAERRDVSPSYFETMQIPWLAGEQCTGSESEGREMVVNQAFVRRYMASRPAVGATIRSGDSGTMPLRIRGVVGDAREFGARHAPVPIAYRCFTMFAYPPLAFLVRTAGDPLAQVEAIRAKLAEIEPGRSIYDVMPLTERIGNEYASDRLRTILSTAFAAAALLLVSLGVYGTLSYIVSLRRREVGLRMALGALQGSIVSLYLGKAMRIVVTACIAGLILAFLVSRAVSGVLFGVAPTDPLSLAGAVVLVLGLAAVAALLPAARAASVEPMVVLREE